MTRKRLWIYHCPVCRQWAACPTLAVWQTAKARRVCRECVASNYGRLRYHIAFLEDALVNTDGTPGGRLKRKADVAPHLRETYRALYRKRQAQLRAAQTRLQQLTQRDMPELVTA